MTEIWKEVKGYEGLYEVSNLGRVRSLDYLHTGQKRLLKLHKNKKNGYLYVQLCKNGKATTKRVHRLVAEAFLENPLGLPEVNHKDECKTNNFVFIDENGNIVPEKSNLEWLSRLDNVRYGTGIERRAKTRSKVMKGKFNTDKSKRVFQYDLEWNLLQEWPSTMEIERQVGWNHGNISECCRGKRKTAYGFRWRYKTV